MKRWQKIALTLIVGVALFSLALILALISVLPDPAEVGRALTSKPTPGTNVASVDKSTGKPANISATPIADAKLETQSQTTASITTSDPAANDVAKDLAARKQRVTAAFADRYLTDDRIHSRVCENLATSPPPFKNAKEFGSQIERSLLGESLPSATAEAIMLPVEFILKNEAIREMIQSARSAAAFEKTGFFQKAQFYALATQVTTSILASRNELEKVSSKAYGLYALSQAVALKPDILQDPDLADLCSRFERSVVDGISQNENEDRENMIRMFERHGISPAEIGYDPHAPNGLRIANDGSSLQLKLPWIEKIFRN